MKDCNQKDMRSNMILYTLYYSFSCILFHRILCNCPYKNPYRYPYMFLCNCLYMSLYIFLSSRPHTHFCMYSNNHLRRPFYTQHCNCLCSLQSSHYNYFFLHRQRMVVVDRWADLRKFQYRCPYNSRHILLCILQHNWSHNHICILQYNWYYNYQNRNSYTSSLQATLLLRQSVAVLPM